MATENENTNIYDDMRKESYKTMLNSEIQASIAKQNALKYTQNQLNQSGYANQGVAQSTNLGIQNSYRNALANAQNTYNTDLANINKEEYTANQNAWANNYTNASDFLANTIKTDDNGNVTDWDKEAYKNYLANYGVTFNGDKADFSNSKFTDADRISAQNAYETALKDYEDTSNGEATADNSTTFKTSVGDMVNFYKGSKTNKNFFIQDSDGKSTELELGAKYTAYPNRIDKAQIAMEANNHKSGDIWLSNNGSYLSLVIKDQDNNVRLVEGTAKTKKDVSSILELFNRYSDLGLKVKRGFGNPTTGDVTLLVDKDGNEYDYGISGNGAIFIKKK